MNQTVKRNNTTLSEIYAIQAKYHGDKADTYGHSFSKRVGGSYILISSLFLGSFSLLGILGIFFNVNDYSITIQEYLLFSSLILSILGVLIWLGTYYKSREREERILEEEYSHKETLVKFFEEYSSRKEISGDKEAKHILLDLHKHVIDNAAYNPSFRLGKEKSDHPTVKVINELSDNLTKVVDKIYDMSGKTSGKNNSAQLSKPNKPKKLKAK